MHTKVLTLSNIQKKYLSWANKVDIYLFFGQNVSYNIVYGGKKSLHEMGIKVDISHTMYKLYKLFKKS